jgi:hypothetical protein
LKILSSIYNVMRAILSEAIFENQGIASAKNASPRNGTAFVMLKASSPAQVQC